MDVLTKLQLMVYNVTEVESNVTSDKTAVIYENGDNPVWSEKDKQSVTGYIMSKSVATNVCKEILIYVLQVRQLDILYTVKFRSYDH